MRPKRQGGGTRHRTTPDPLALQVGKRVRDLRTARGFPFDAFVEYVELGRGYVSELDRGLVVPTITALAKIAETLGVTIADLVLSDSPRDALYEATRNLSAEALQHLHEEALKLQPPPPSSD